jgi:hypothetical protein
MTFTEWTLTVLWLVVLVQGFVMATILYRSSQARASGALQTGTRLPALQLTSQGGTPASLRDLTASPTMVCIVTKGCPMCERMIPELGALAKAQPSLSIVLVAGNTPQEAEELKAQTRTELPMYSASMHVVLRRLNIHAVPYVFWVGDNGVIQHQGALNKKTRNFWLEELPRQFQVGSRTAHG